MHKRPAYEQYMEDIKLRLALVKLLEIIGEAANYVTKDTQDKFNEVKWNTLYVVRNILVHEYFGINYDIIWQAIIDKIPELKVKVESVLQQMSIDRE
ncbi:HepT-like ribonuclease domain-containing protein [Larkinella rosea]